jgi:hypothetical protein
MLTDEPVEGLTIEEAKEKMTGVDDAKEKNSAEEKESDVENLPVVAQVKILYNLEQTLDVIMTMTRTRRRARRTRWRVRRK